MWWSWDFRENIRWGRWWNYSQPLNKGSLQVRIILSARSSCREVSVQSTPWFRQLLCREYIVQYSCSASVVTYTKNLAWSSARFPEPIYSILQPVKRSRKPATKGICGSQSRRASLRCPRTSLVVVASSKVGGTYS